MLHFERSQRNALRGCFRMECLNATWFMSLDDARRKIEAWRTYYNES